MQSEQQPIIVAVAFQLGDLTLSLPKPARHHDVLHHYYDMTGRTLPSEGKWEQGFLTNFGTYVGRKTAKKIAVAAGQYRAFDGYVSRGELDYQGEELFSEDVW